MGTSQFETETALTVQETAHETVQDEGRWSTHVSGAWSIGTNPNGGYLLSPVLRAMREIGAHPDPLTVTTHFLRPGLGEQPGEVEVEVVRVGRTMSTLRGRLIQEGKARIETIAGFSDLGASTEAEPVFTTEPPDLPPPDQCLERSGLEQGVELPILDRAVDTLALPLFADAFPPPIFGALGFVGWVPTIEMTVHIRQRPAPGWIMGRFEAHDLHDGRMVENGDLWDETGALVARSRQVALVRND